MSLAPDIAADKTPRSKRLPTGHSNYVLNMCHRASLAPSRASVLRHLAARLDFNTWTTHPTYKMSVAAIATDAEVCDRTVHYVLADLKEMGLVTWEHRDGRTSRYRLNVERLEQLVEAADRRRNRARAARAARNAGKTPIGRPGEKGDADYERPLRAKLIDVGDVSDVDGLPEWVPTRVPAGYSRSELYAACVQVAGLLWPTVPGTVGDPVRGGPGAVVRPLLRLWKRWDHGPLEEMVRDLEAYVVALRTCKAIPFAIARGLRFVWSAPHSAKVWKQTENDATDPKLLRPGRILSHMRILPSRLELARAHARGECGCCSPAGQVDAGDAPVPGQALRWAFEGPAIDGAELDPAGLWARTAARLVDADVEIDAVDVQIVEGALVVMLSRYEATDAVIEALAMLSPLPPFGIAFR